MNKLIKIVGQDINHSDPQHAIFYNLNLYRAHIYSLALKIQTLLMSVL